MNKLLNLPLKWYLGGVLVIGAVVRAIGLSKASVWHDEGFTMMLAPMSPLEIIERTARDVHPPLYYLFLHYWIAVFGNSEVSARGMSAVMTLAIIPIAYLLVRRLWNETAARIAGILVATGPLLVRYGQEARMYGMVALILAGATYALVKALDSNKWQWWGAYSTLIAAGLYTHYYTIFVIVAHWLYVLLFTRKAHQWALRNPKWWLANIVAAVAFVPWLPSLIDQFTRVQSGFWIPPVNLYTIPGTLTQALVFHSDVLFGGLRLLLAAAFAVGLAALFRRHTDKRPSLALLTLHCLTGPVLVWLLSFGRPIYVDRYFVFAAVAFYCLLAIMLTSMAKKAQLLALGLTLAVFTSGLVSVYAQANHQMRVVGTHVNDNFQPGDFIISGELYTYFDYSYYNQTGAPVHLWSKGKLSGYGETSLIYDRANEIVISDLETITPESRRVWLVGKPGDKDYWKDVPTSWQAVGERVVAKDSAVQQYLVLPRESDSIAVQ